MAKRSLLIIEDEELVRQPIRHYFSSRGYDVIEAPTLLAARGALDRAFPDGAILDHVLPDGDSFELLSFIRERAPKLAVVLLTGHATIDLAVRAMQAGAHHVLAKPIDLSALASVLERTIESRRAWMPSPVERVPGARRRPDPFLGGSQAIRKLFADARQALPSHTPVLILGPTGAGKGVVAAWIHGNGPRTAEPFVDVNCATLSREFLETELFGHRRGAFTGAVRDKLGLLELADRGTLFLDEIGDMAPAVQAKILKVVEEGRFRRLGDVRDRVVDVRIIAATHRELPRLVQEGRFREDLYYRINAFPLRVPPLRERLDDLPVLAGRIVEDLTREEGGEPAEILPGALEVMMAHDWPGNVRELRNVLERAILLAGGPRIGAEHLRFGAGTDERFDDPESSQSRDAIVPDPALEMTLGELESRHIARMFEACEGRVDETARRLGIPRSTLYQRLRELGIPLRR